MRAPRVREMKEIAHGFLTPPGYRLLLPEERDGPITTAMIGYDRITDTWVTLYRYAAEKYPMEKARFPVARRVPAKRRRDK